MNIFVSIVIDATFMGILLEISLWDSEGEEGVQENKEEQTDHKGKRRRTYKQRNWGLGRLEIK